MCKHDRAESVGWNTYFAEFAVLLSEAAGDLVAPSGRGPAVRRALTVFVCPRGLEDGWSPSSAGLKCTVP